ncbi:MAG: helix-turn-helix transcriptional regulator [Bacteroidales bacterium]|jgi:putative transcriptional regulator|nr:helix-turn-helix transcriptional regulator [Bacteroidales bacterium]MCK9498054.1 helix-turn-helix transcriptional regulator [Bacteroidales bacterium]MDY0314286.1 helix-turn-helix transcriptional regulator [Bacteroidales bacterium]NLB85606.1 helix-turn-helix transcriptional regulator [Bacteroidales bacterium]
MINKIKEERKRLNLTQDELAKKVGVSRQSINAIETGKYNPSVILALKLSEMFDKSVNELFELSKEDRSK